MDFGFDARTEEFRAKLLAFMDSHVLPAECVFAGPGRQAAAEGGVWERPV